MHININGIILITLDSGGCITEINNYGCKILEINRDEVLGLNWFENFLPENIRDENKGLFEKTITSITDDMFINENIMLTAKKKEKIIRWYNQILKDDKNNIIGVLCSGEDITEFRTIQSELRKNKDLFKGLLDTIADGIVIINKEGTIIYVNQAAEKLFGRPLKYLLGENFGFPVARGKSIEIEIHHKNKYITIAEMRIGESEWNGDICYIASLRDITERKYAEKRQNLATNVFKILNEHGDRKIILDNILKSISTTMGIEAIGVRLSEDGDYPFFHTIGIPQEILDQEKYVFHHNPDNTIVYRSNGNPLSYCLCGDILNSGIDKKINYITKEGSFWSDNLPVTIAGLKEKGIVLCRRGICLKKGFKTIAGILLKSGKSIIGLLQLFSGNKDMLTEKDITFLESVGNGIALTISRIMMEQNLHASEERFRNIFEESLTYCFLISESGFILDVNKATLNNLGYNANEIIGEKLIYFYTEESQKKINMIINVWKRETIQNEELEIKTKTGEIRTVLASTNPIFDKPGKILYIISQQTDITEQKQLEIKFLQAQKMEAIGTFSGGIAHDFNNVLTIIKSYSEFLLDKFNRNDLYYPDIKEIHEAASRAASLTSQLLAFSRKQVLKPREIDLNQLINNLSRMQKRIIGEDICLNLSLDKNIPQVKVDPGQMEQVIMNLMVNSRDAMKNGGVFTITTDTIQIGDENITEYPELNEGLYIRLHIEDTGCGIEKKLLKQIFDPFFTTKEPGKGTGLGLSVVYGIIKQHRGAISVESELNKGTMFTIYLPTNRKDRWNIIDIKNEKAEQILLRGDGKKILFVEDDTIIRKFMAGQLRKLDFNVIDVGSAEETLHVPEDFKKTVDILFCDIVLPGKSGFILIDELHAINRDFKILLTSGYSEEKAKADEIERRDLYFISKPYSLHEILQAIKILLP